MAKYREIADRIAAEVKHGAYAADGLIPGECNLASRFGVARETVRRAIAALAKEGLLERRRGLGTFLTKRGMRKTGLIALMMPDVAGAGIFDVLANEFGRICARNGYEMVLGKPHVRTPESAAHEVRRIAREMAVRRVEGVIFRPFIDERMAPSNREVVRIFRNAEIPLVLIDSDIVDAPERSECDLVAVDNVSAGRRVAEHLFERGRRRVAFMMSGLSIRANVNWRNRLFGVAGEMALRGAECPVRILDFKPDSRKELERLFRSRSRPDAIVCGNDETAAVLVKALHRIGKRIPEDVAVVGFDDTSCAASCEPPLTTVRQPAKLIARETLRMLLARIAHPGLEVRELHLPTPLVVRAST